MTMPKDVQPIQLRPDGGRLWPTMFRSATLDLRCNVFVYTPPGVSGKGSRLGRLPVLYLLHGMWGSEIDWPFKGNAQAILDGEILAGRLPPMIVAMPHDGLADDGTFYANWHADRPGLAAEAGDRRCRRFEDYFINDLRTHVEVDLAGRMRPREQRVIAGLSMGGFGALMLALRRPDLFAAAASLSGAVRAIRMAKFADLDERIFGPGGARTNAYRREHLPAFLAEDPARGGRVRMYLDCGRRDLLLWANRKFHRRLVSLGIDHVYHEYAGAHNWPSWRKRLPHVLQFFAQELTISPR